MRMLCSRWTDIQFFLPGPVRMILKKKRERHSPRKNASRWQLASARAVAAANRGQSSGSHASSFAKMVAAARQKREGTTLPAPAAPPPDTRTIVKSTCDALINNVDGLVLQAFLNELDAGSAVAPSSDAPKPQAKSMASIPARSNQADGNKQFRSIWQKPTVVTAAKPAATAETEGQSRVAEAAAPAADSGRVSPSTAAAMRRLRRRNRSPKARLQGREAKTSAPLFDPADSPSTRARKARKQKRDGRTARRRDSKRGSSGDGEHGPGAAVGFRPKSSALSTSRP